MNAKKYKKVIMLLVLCLILSVMVPMRMMHADAEDDMPDDDLSGSAIAILPGETEKAAAPEETVAKAEESDTEAETPAPLETTAPEESEEPSEESEKPSEDLSGSATDAVNVTATPTYTPSQFPDYLGFMGDSSDNIPGVPGIGPKSAQKLLSQYGSMEGVYENLDKLKGKQLENIRDNRELAFLSRKIATIVTDLDFELDVDEVSWPSFDTETVTEAYKAIRFSAHLDKLLKLVGQEGAAPTAPAFELAETVEGKEALALIERALSEGERVSVAFSKPTQESLFAPEITLAVTTSQGVALVESDEALSIFARIAKEGSFAALDAKAALHEVYPVDSSESALLTELEEKCKTFSEDASAFDFKSADSASRSKSAWTVTWRISCGKQGRCGILPVKGRSSQCWIIWRRTARPFW